MAGTPNNLKTLRKEKRMVQQELMVKAGISPAMIVAIERYNYLPVHKSREKIAEALGVDENELWPSICTHHWKIDSEGNGFCLKCGDIKNFPTVLKVK